MALNVVFQYTQLNNQYIQIGPVYEAAMPGVPLGGATVLATLYIGRIPPGTPGTPVPGAISISLVDQGSGIYRGLISGADFGTPTVGSNYITTIDCTALDGSVAHWEIPSVVQVRSS